MKKHIVTEGQTLLDIATEKYGSASGILFLIEDNTGLTSVTQSVSPGMSLLIREELINPSVVRHFYTRKLRVNTGVYEQASSGDSDWILASGIWRDEGLWIDEETWIDN